MERLLCPVTPAARLAAAGLMHFSWRQAEGPLGRAPWDRGCIRRERGPANVGGAGPLKRKPSRSDRRLLGRHPGAVMTAIENVTGREACGRLAEVLQAQPRATASTQRNRALLDPVFD